jgi:hypothetical protein
MAFDAIWSAGNDAMSLPAEVELELLPERGTPLDPVPLLELEHPATITPAAAIVATVIRAREVCMPILVAEPCWLVRPKG